MSACASGAARTPAGILAVATPAAWVNDALAHWPEVLLDHANCEKKAASTALALMFAYPEDRALCVALARLAREELRHFEQVATALNAAGVAFRRQRPGRYAQGLRAALRTADPGRKLDLLLMSALIEARSAERFGLLAPRLPSPLGRLYADLGACEARHFELYVGFAREVAPTQWRARLAELAACEAQLVTTPEEVLRFHSGPLPRGPAAQQLLTS
jgi:tRNA 2-(methylsulfanyl)-N6-isopentenyladenosine37 hydroxylase